MGADEIKKPRGLSEAVWDSLGHVQQDVLARAYKSKQFKPAEVNPGLSSSRISALLRSLLLLGLVKRVEKGLYEVVRK